MKLKSILLAFALMFTLAIAVIGQGPSPTPQAPPVPARLRISQGVFEGLIIHKVAPEYPEAAKAKHIEGDVIVKLAVDSQGKVIEVSPLRGPEELVGSAMEAVKQWRSRPYLLNGKPIEIETTALVKFRL